MKQAYKHASKKQSGTSYKTQINPKQIRQRVCDEAARIMIEEGINDFHQAKHKAGSRLNTGKNLLLPSNKEIEASLQERLQLYATESTRINLNHYRQIAVELMIFLSPFRPRIVGEILDNYVTPSSSIKLHLFAQTPEEVSLFLADHQIFFKIVDRRFKYGRDRTEYTPAMLFSFKDIPIESAIFPTKGLRQAPLSPIHGNPMKRATVDQLQRRANQAE